ncbi:hypothetical protein, partial [Pigmentiphaga humi]|uniref:hypothetical protein n=1 Tax=Pigmentiphaga humi TaxID=2478468 RepID=UPI001CA439DF
KTRRKGMRRKHDSTHPRSVAKLGEIVLQDSFVTPHARKAEALLKSGAPLAYCAGPTVEHRRLYLFSGTYL